MIFNKVLFLIWCKFGRFFTNFNDLSLAIKLATTNTLITNSYVEICLRFYRGRNSFSTSTPLSIFDCTKEAHTLTLCPHFLSVVCVHTRTRTHMCFNPVGSQHLMFSQCARHCFKSTGLANLILIAIL